MSPRTSARTVMTASAGASACRTLLATSSVTTNWVSASSASPVWPAIHAATALRAAAGASVAVGSVSSTGAPRAAPSAPARGASGVRSAADFWSGRMRDLLGIPSAAQHACAAREDLHRCSEDQCPALQRSAGKPIQPRQKRALLVPTAYLRSRRAQAARPERGIAATFQARALPGALDSLGNQPPHAGLHLPRPF